MSLDHNAIMRAYPDFGVIDDGAGVFDKSGNKIEIDQALVDAARTALDAEAAANKYKTDRLGGTLGDKVGTYYADIGDQLDMLYKDMLAGKLDTTGTWATHIKTVKDANPKP